MTITKDTLAALAKLDTPTVCDVIELFHVRPRNQGYMDQRIRAHFPDLPPMVGFAVTSSFRSAAPPDGPPARHPRDHQLEIFAQLPGPAVVVFQDLDDPPAAATFGDGLCSVFQSFGAAGLVTSGLGRDIEQVRELNFPVYSSGLICAHGYTHTLHVGNPVRVGGLVVRQGDLLHGDANGVTSIPLDIANEIPDVAAEFSALERAVIEFPKTGSKTIAQCADARNEFNAAIAKIIARVRRG